MFFQAMQSRSWKAAAACACFLACTGAAAAKTLFTQQDHIQSFDFVTGQVIQAGTAVGTISGTSAMDLRLTPSGPPAGDILPFTFSGHATITDLDGDQITFEANGTGSFHLGVPGAGFVGSGGPLRGTYTVTAGTGKYATWQPGTTFTYQAVLTVAPARSGTVFGDVSYKGAPPR